MVAIARSSASTRIDQILRVTAKHFEICASPGPQLALPQGEFIDPLRFRWSNTPTPHSRQPPSTDSRARLSGMRPA